MVELEDQRGSWSTSTAATAQQAVVDGGVSATAKDKRSNQAVTEHHGNPMKLESGFAGAEARRRAMAMVKRTRWRCCRPRGRKAMSGVSEQSQSTRAGWLGSQRIDGAVAGFAEDGNARQRRHSSTEQRWRRREKQRSKTAKNGDGEGLIEQLRSKRKPRMSLLLASAKPNVATAATGTR